MMEKYNMNQTTLKILGLYREDYRRSLHLRRISRETAIDVKSIQLQLRRLEKVRILSSTVKGRNKEYSLNLSNLLTRFYMVLAETFTTITFLGENFLIKRILDGLEGRVEGVIILFGSFAKGQIRKESDVDLFVLTVQKPNVPIRVAREVGEIVDKEININSMDENEFLAGFERGAPLIREVVSEHIILKGIDNFCDILWRSHARQY